MKLDATTASDRRTARKSSRICTVYAQKGMWNIFIVIFCFALALPFFNPYFFIGYLIAIAFFGLFQAIFMANAGGAWDNAKKIVEVDLRQKGTDLHAATVVGDTVGDPFKDTSSVALNPVIKFTTLFGLLAVEIAVTMKNQGTKTAIGAFFFLVALVFVYRSFYSMRIPLRSKELTCMTKGPAAMPAPFFMLRTTGVMRSIQPSPLASPTQGRRESKW
ncbi:MAG: sodium/proton-translocating pyrophosphatase [Desulfosudis oleivorans]|nr:sodium/proton-translocating pyrophosphatase [Desulfosudis oleivorans]